MTKIKDVLWPYPARASRAAGSRLGVATPSNRPYWEENHWRWDRKQTTLSGRFRTPYSAPRGKITRHHDGTYSVYIINPPPELWRHPHKSCFRSAYEAGVYYIHFASPIREHSLDAAIMEVERILVV